MHDIMETIKTPTFLIGTVVVSLVLNILSSYIKQLIDFASSSVMKRMSRMVEAQNGKDIRNYIRMGTDSRYHRRIRLTNELYRACIACLLTLAISSFGAGFLVFVFATASGHVQDPHVAHEVKRWIGSGVGMFWLTASLYMTLRKRCVYLILSEQYSSVTEPQARIKGVSKGLRQDGRRSGTKVVVAEVNSKA
jgi:hypothetical protein